jgi:hypothetical protein
MVYVGTLDTTPDRDAAWIRAFRDLGVEVLPYSSSPRGVPAGLAGRFSRRFNISRAYDVMQAGSSAREAAEAGLGSLSAADRVRPQHRRRAQSLGPR